VADEDTVQSKVLRVLGSVTASTTVLAALMFYFGRQHAYWFFDHFGVNFTVMGLTAQDYLIRSADGLFMPLTVVAGVGLVGLWVHRLLRARLSSKMWRRVVRTSRWASLALGVACTALAVVAVVEPVLFYGYPALPGACLAVGVILLATVTRPNRRAATGVAVAEWGAVFLLVSAGLFWAVTDYSASVGLGRAVQVEAELQRAPSVSVYSRQSLNLAAPGVRQTVCKTPEAAYGFRNTGMKLVLESGGQYFLLPSTWHPAAAPAVILPRSDAVRLEFTTGTEPSSC